MPKRIVIETVVRRREVEFDQKIVEDSLFRRACEMLGELKAATGSIRWEYGDDGEVDGATVTIETITTERQEL